MKRLCHMRRRRNGGLKNRKRLLFFDRQLAYSELGQVRLTTQQCLPRVAEETVRNTLVIRLIRRAHSRK